MLALKKLLKKPKLEEGSLLALFYYCDISVNYQMDELNKIMRVMPDNLDRRANQIKQLKEAQHTLMNVIMNITEQAIPNDRAPRDFQAKYPDDVIIEQINGPIWFGAECIAAGSHIANHELESEELRPYAVQLSKVVSKVRQALREQCFTNRSRITYSQKLKDLLQAFDEQWADFEFRYVSLMCNVKSESQFYQLQEVVVLFCESTLRAIQHKFLTYDMIEMMDPSAMFAIPRLAIFCGLIVYPDGPLNPSKPQNDMPPCFRAYQQLLTRMKDLLGLLTEDQLSTLEQALCSAEGLGTLERNKRKAAASKVKQTKTHQSQTRIPSSVSGTDVPPPEVPPRPVSASTPTMNTHAESTAASSRPTNTPLPVRQHNLAPPTQRPFSATSSPAHSYGGASAATEFPRSTSYDLDSREDSNTVFEPLPPTPADSIEGGHQLVVEEPEFPRLTDQPVVNDLPSRSTSSTTDVTASSSGSNQVPQVRVGVATESCRQATALKAPRKSKHKGPGGFPSAEDLMHRLFLGISGVADQLQSNHAKDLRVILKYVFTVCQSEPEDTPFVSSFSKRGEQCEVEPCTPEPQSPLVTDSQSFTFSSGALSSEPHPTWVPDNETVLCSRCEERFSWKKRRHHCRRCGNVVCSQCSKNNLPLPQFGINKPVRVCSTCYVSQLAKVSHLILPQSLQVQ